MNICILFYFIYVVNANKSIEHLQRFGYIAEESSTDSIAPGIELYQETFNLTQDGTFNNETLNFMALPRCGNKDEMSPFSASPYRKWSTNIVTWYMYGGGHLTTIVDRAFNLWSKHANISFIKQRANPMVTLTMSDTQHLCYSQRNTCRYDFDGPGGVLAHAFQPLLSTTNTDVHFDKTENWDYSMNRPAWNQSSFYLTAVHEIGHAIGLDHSFVKGTAMWPISFTPYGISDMYQFDLHEDDINAVQFLYGKPNIVAANTTSKPTTTTTVPYKTDESTTPTNLDICTVRKKFNTFFVFKNNIYVINNKLVWVLPLDEALRTPEHHTKPKLITEWLPFLPQNFTKITAMYQRSNDEIVLIIDNLAYYIQTPSLTLIDTKDLQTMIGKPFSQINGAVSTNQGKTFLFVDEKYVFEINDCTRKGVFKGETSTTFLGIPGVLSGVFRYTNGKLYFITQGTRALEFDEFQGSVTQTVDVIFDFLGISCVRGSLLSKLYQLIKHIRK